MAPNYTKLKTNLRLAVNRLKLLEKKKTELALKSRKEIADYVAAGKDERAKIRVEHIIREDYLVEAMELVEMYCDLLLARMGLIQQMKAVDEGLQEAISSVLWVTPRLQAEIPEFNVISDQFTAKYGKPFVQSARENSLGSVSEKLMHKLSVQAPPKILVEKYMVEITKSHNVPYVADINVMQQDEVYAAEAMLIDLGANQKPDAGVDSKAPRPTASATTAGPPGPVPSPFQYPPPLPTAPPVGQPHSPAGAFPPGSAAFPPGVYPGGPPAQHPYGHPNKNPNDINYTYNEPPSYNTATSPDNLNLPDLPNVPGGSFPNLGGGSGGNGGNNVGENSAGGDDVDFDDLTKRFEELKKKK